MEILSYYFLSNTILGIAYIIIESTDKDFRRRLSALDLFIVAIVHLFVSTIFWNIAILWGFGIGIHRRYKMIKRNW